MSNISFESTHGTKITCIEERGGGGGGGCSNKYKDVTNLCGFDH